MLPEPHTRPPWLPLRLIITSALLACGILAWGHVPSQEWARFLAGLTIVSADGTTLATAMAGRLGNTLGIITASMLVAVTTGLAAGFLALRVGLGLPWLAWLAGRLVAALPVVPVAWTAVGIIVGRHGWPIDSLLPRPHPPDGETWQLALGRHLWWWVVPCGVLVLPLAGESLSRVIDLFSKGPRGDLALGLRARGIKRSAIHYHHTFPAVLPELLDFVQALGLLAAGYVVFVEKALGIPGWGSFFAAAVNAGNVRGIAGSIYTAGVVAALWCLCIDVVRHLSSRPRAPREGKPADAPRSTPATTTAAGLALLVLVCCSFTSPPAASAGAAQLGALIAPLVGDLWKVAAACAAAALVALIRGGLPAVFGALRLPRLGLLETLAWSPLLVWLIGVSAILQRHEIAWITAGVAASFGGAVQVRRRWRVLQAGRAIEGSRAVGTGALGAWRMHVMPELLRTVFAWILKAAATLIVWIALIDSLQVPVPGASPASLGLAIASAKENVLTDLPPMIAPALIIAICALFFRQLSRIVRPAPPPL